MVPNVYYLMSVLSFCYLLNSTTLNLQDECKCEDAQMISCQEITDNGSSSNCKCIHAVKICDKFIDCSDKSDELQCFHDCSVTCDDGLQCLNLADICDGKIDCVDESDESRCSTTERQMNNTGYRCDEEEGICGQICEDDFSSKFMVNCSCYHGYQLVNRTYEPFPRHCRAQGPEPGIILADRTVLRWLPLVRDEKNEDTKVKDEEIYTHLENTISVDYHFEQRLFFWLDINVKAIKSAPLHIGSPTDTDYDLSASMNVKNIVTAGLVSPDGIAVDWINDKLYWTDSELPRIEVCDLDGSNRKVLLWKRMGNPRSIVVHPRLRLLLWTDWGDYPRIESAQLDGSNRRVIVDTNISWPNGLTIDHADDRKIYWLDAKNQVIERVDIDGSNRITLISGLVHPFGITVFEEEIYWTDWRTKTINRANKFSGSILKYKHPTLIFPTDLHVVHPLRQPKSDNPCRLKPNNGCSHICLPNAQSYSCACPTEMNLLEDNKTCHVQSIDLLVFTRRSDIRRLSLKPSIQLQGGENISDERIDAVMNLTGIKSAVALDWISLSKDNGYLYWSDVTKHSISRASWNGSHQHIIIDKNVKRPAGLAVDWVTKKLYWTDDGMDRIEVSSLNGKIRTILVWENLEKPRDIVVDPIGGYMYWTDWGDSAKIERAGMDGSERSIIIDKQLEWPNGLAIDYVNETLYWTDAGMMAIECSNLDGTNRRVVIANLPHPFGITLHGNRLFWTDWETKSIESLNKDTGTDRKLLASNLKNLMDIDIFDESKRQNYPSPCAANNGGCSHLCLLAPLTDEGYSCTCPTGIMLMDDRRTCRHGMLNFFIIASRTDIRMVSLDVEYFADVIIPINDLKDVVAIDVDRKTGRIYWSDRTKHKIFSSIVKNHSHIEVIKEVSTGIHSVYGIAIDSTGRNIYWTDAIEQKIEVSNLNFTKRKVLIGHELDSPRTLVLHYSIGVMFWADWGNQPRIERADMDGQNRKVIVSENLGWPNGLTIDRPNGRLYWTDAKTKVIEASDLDGRDRKVLISSVKYPYGITIVGEHIYWTDWEQQAILKAEKDSGANIEILQKNLPGLMDIHAVQLHNTERSACDENNGGCSYLCLRSPRGFSCTCPTGIHLKSDEHNCYEYPHRSLFFASTENIQRISFDTDDLNNILLPIPEISNVIGLSFHYKFERLFFTDVNLDVIRSVKFDGSDPKTILSRGLSGVNGLAVDWIANNLYLTDNGRNVIEVCRLDGSSRKIIVNSGIDAPRAIAVYPRKGLLFWSDWGKNPKIERSFLDGSQRSALISTNLGWPNGLTIDYNTDRIYWTDANLDRIEVSNLDGTNRKVLVTDLPHPYGLTLGGGEIYWTDWSTKSIEKADKFTGERRVSVLTELEDLKDLKMVSAERQSGSNPCDIRNGGCSHLCLYRPHGYICACPIVEDSKHPCSTVPGEVTDDPLMWSTPTSSVLQRSTLKKSTIAYFQREIEMVENSTAHFRPDIMNNISCTGDECILSNSISDQTALVYIIIMGAILFILLTTMCIGISICQQRRKRVRNSSNNSRMMNFSNPSYNTSNMKKSNNHSKKSWMKFLQRDNSDSFYDPPTDQLSNLEAAALVGKSELCQSTFGMVPPPPPTRIDSTVTMNTLQWQLVPNSPSVLSDANNDSRTNTLVRKTLSTVETDI